LKYGAQPEAREGEDLFEYITRVRSDSFNINVKRRVMLGNFLLSSKFGQYNEKVRMAQKVRHSLIEAWDKEIRENQIDMVISPTTIGEEPPKIDDIIAADDRERNPVFEFKMDYYTAFANSLGIPAVTLPVQEGYTIGDKKSLFPSSVKIHALMGEDYHLLRIA
jgi:aspartyl-tRNA(Asn)/glutamyl-tRNA(Gln) amidotransferase subunit A